MTSLAVANSDAISFRVCDVWGGGSLPLRVYVLAVRRAFARLDGCAHTPRPPRFLGFPVVL